MLQCDIFKNLPKCNEALFLPWFKELKDFEFFKRKTVSNLALVYSCLFFILNFCFVPVKPAATWRFMHTKFPVPDGTEENSNDITSNQEAAGSPTGGIAELVQQMEKTILLWCSCLHLGHTEHWALLRDAVLTRSTQTGTGEKPKEGNEPACLGGQRQNTFKGQTQNVRYTWTNLQKTPYAKKKRILTGSDHAVLVQTVFPTGWLGWLLNNVEKTEYCLAQWQVIPAD